MNVTVEEFNKAVYEFLSTQDDYDRDDWYTTDRESSEHVLGKFRDYLFVDTEKEERRKQYLELKAEFEND